MESLLLLQGFLFTIAVVAILWKCLRNDQAYARKFSRVRVPVDDHRHSASESKEEEEFDGFPIPILLIFGTLAVLIFLLIARGL